MNKSHRFTCFLFNCVKCLSSSKYFLAKKKKLQTFCSFVFSITASFQTLQKKKNQLLIPGMRKRCNEFFNWWIFNEFVPFCNILSVRVPHFFIIPIVTLTHFSQQCCTVRTNLASRLVTSSGNWCRRRPSRDQRVSRCQGHHRTAPHSAGPNAVLLSGPSTRNWQLEPSNAAPSWHSGTLGTYKQIKLYCNGCFNQRHNCPEL